jgi:hypothetical protein
MNRHERRKQKVMLENPLIVMFELDNKIVCHIHRHKSYGYEHFGLLIYDLVRHVARAFDVAEDDVWQMVAAERRRPTTDITNPDRGRAP